MNLDINAENIIYNGKEYATRDVKVTLTLKNKAKGKMSFFCMSLLYEVLSIAGFSLVTSSGLKGVYDYALLIYVSILFILILSMSRFLLKYYWE